MKCRNVGNNVSDLTRSRFEPQTNALPLDQLTDLWSIGYRASATETVDLGSIPGWFKSKTIKIGILNFLYVFQHYEGHCKASTVCGRQVGSWQLDSEDRKVLSLSPSQGDLVNKLQLPYHWLLPKLRFI